MKVEGRDEFRKLVNPIINKNYNFSEDYILSSNTFYPELIETGRTISTATGDSIYGADSNKTFRHTAAALTTELSVGDGLFAKWSTGAIAYIGRLANYTPSSNLITLEDFPKTSLNEASNVYLFIRKASDKEYVLGKALSSNAYETNTVSSLTGLSDKGIIFQSGTELESDGDGSALVSTAADTHALAMDIPLEPIRMSSDKMFQSKLKGITSSEETFDVVNSLLDFTVLGLTASEDFTLVELAPYVPLTLGRVDDNPANVTDATFTDVTLTTTAVTNTEQLLAIPILLFLFLVWATTFINNNKIFLCFPRQIATG